MERVPPSKPHRGETSRDHAAHDPVGQWIDWVKRMGQKPDGERLRQAGRGDPNPDRHPQSLYRPWHTRY